MFPYGFDPSTLQPSETGRSAPTIGDLAGNIPPNDNAGHYEKLMQFLTQPKHDMGPEHRRALGGMPMEHGTMDPDASGPQMNHPAVARFLSFLFGGQGG